jgi:hypothetical protein
VKVTRAIAAHGRPRRKLEVSERHVLPLKSVATEPPDHRSPVALGFLVPQEEADTESVVERHLGELSRGSANQCEAASSPPLEWSREEWRASLRALRRVLRRAEPVEREDRGRERLLA